MKTTDLIQLFTVAIDPNTPTWRFQIVPESRPILEKMPAAGMISFLLNACELLCTISKVPKGDLLEGLQEHAHLLPDELRETLSTIKPPKVH